MFKELLFDRKEPQLPPAEVITPILIDEVVNQFLQQTYDHFYSRGILDESFEIQKTFPTTENPTGTITVAALGCTITVRANQSHPDIHLKFIDRGLFSMSAASNHIEKRFSSLQQLQAYFTTVYQRLTLRDADHISDCLESD